MNKLHLRLGLARHCVECCRSCPALCLPVPVPTLTQRVQSCPSSDLQSHFCEHGDHRRPRAIWSSPASHRPPCFPLAPSLSCDSLCPGPTRAGSLPVSLPPPAPLVRGINSSICVTQHCLCLSVCPRHYLKLPCASVVCHPLLKNCIYQITKS